MDTLRFEAADGVGTITLHRPDRRNGITNAMIGELYALLGELRDRTDVRVVELTGSGDWFCPGADFGHFASGAETVKARREWFAIPALLHELPQVTVCTINGPCAGAGLAWACACDLRLASSTAVFNTAFLAVAVPGDMGLPWTLPRLVGAGRARDLLLRPRKFSAADALAWGLVAEVAEPTELRAAASTVIEGLLAMDPAAMAALKANIVQAERMGLRDYLDLETERHLRISRGSGARDAFARRAGS